MTNEMQFADIVPDSPDDVGVGEAYLRVLTEIGGGDIVHAGSHEANAAFDDWARRLALAEAAEGAIRSALVSSPPVLIMWTRLGPTAPVVPVPHRLLSDRVLIMKRTIRLGFLASANGIGEMTDRPVWFEGGAWRRACGDIVRQARGAGGATTPVSAAEIGRWLDAQAAHDPAGLSSVKEAWRQCQSAYPTKSIPRALFTETMRNWRGNQPLSR